MEMVARGNLREVYLDAELERYAANANSRAERQGPLDAEIVPDCRGCWYVLVTQPGEERSLAAHLVGRRYGIYVPTISTRTVVRGKVHVRIKLMFPGYIFVFGWGIQEQQRRILACPGATRLLHTESGRLLSVADDKIDEIQGIEAANDEEVRSAMVAVVDADHIARKPCKRSKWKKWKKKKRKHVAHTPPAEPVATHINLTISTRSHWTGIETLSDEARISLLHSALGLGLSVASSPVSPG